MNKPRMFDIWAEPFDRRICVLSYFNEFASSLLDDDFEPMERILGFYSTRQRAEQESFLVRAMGLDDELHYTLRSVGDLVRAGILVEYLSEVGFSPEETFVLGRGERCTEGHNWGYPWEQVYTDRDQIFALINTPFQFRDFVVNRERRKPLFESAPPNAVDISSDAPF